MNVSDLMTLYDYNYWANRRILEAAAQLSPEELVAPQNLSWGSIRDVLVHMMGAEWLWRIRCQEHRSPSAMLDPREFPTVESIAARWAEEENAMRAYLASLTEDDLSQPLAYVTTAGRPFSSTLWHILVHVVNHGTQHRAEIAQVLTQLGHSPGDLDMILYDREMTDSEGA